MEDVSEGDPVVSEVQVRRPGEGRVTGSQERTPERSLPASAGAAAVRAPFAGVARPACLLGGTCSQGWQRAAPLGILFRVGTARRPLSMTRPLRRLASSPEHTPLLLPPLPSFPVPQSVPHMRGPRAGSIHSSPHGRARCGSVRPCCSSVWLRPGGKSFEARPRCLCSMSRESGPLQAGSWGLHVY